MTDYIPINPWSERSEYNNCMCDFCHNVTSVVKLHYQKTGYYLQKDGKRPLSQKECQVWICDDCRNKIIDCLVSKVKKEV